MLMSALFLTFVAAVVFAMVAAALWFIPKTYRAPFIIGVAAWVVYAALLGGTGILANAALRPPGIVYVFIPTIALVAFTARSRAGLRIAASVPIALLIGAESMRIVVELFLDRLWHAGALPTMMTFHGANFDILIGASAPIVGALYARNRLDPRIALAWNVLGLGSLANIIGRNVLSSPALHLIATDVPGNAIGTFPYSFIPAFIVPLALALHVAAIRSLIVELRTSESRNSIESTPPAAAAGEPLHA
jgi:hypothetical protein